jgi:hypothetical protein
MKLIKKMIFVNPKHDVFRSEKLTILSADRLMNVISYVDLANYFRTMIYMKPAP